MELKKILNVIGSLHAINSEALKRTIQDLQSLQERGSWHGQSAAKRYLQRRLEFLAIQPMIQTYLHDGRTWENIVASFPGVRFPARKILAVAHYDSKNWTNGLEAPGADDNGSGVAILLLLAEILKSLSFRNTMEIVFFSNEEYGRLGSKAFVNEAQARGDEIRAVFNIDVIGYNNPAAIFSSEPFSILGSTFQWKRKGKMLAKLFYNLMLRCNGSKPLEIIVPREAEKLIPTDRRIRELLGSHKVNWSMGDVPSRGDEGSFWSGGYQAVAMNSIYRHPYRHTIFDTTKYLNFNTIMDAAEISLKMLLYWDNTLD